MSSVYTGVPGNVTPSASPTETIPADGDTLAVSSANVALQKLLDYVAQVYSTLTGAGQANVGNQAAKLASGGGGSPVKGAANLVPQAAPSTPDNGDIWVQTTTNDLRVRINGITFFLLTQNLAGFTTLNFVGNPGNVASTNYFAWGAPSQAAVAANGTARANGQTTNLAGSDGVLRALIIRTGQLTAGGTVTVTVMKNGGATGFAQTITAGTAANTVFVVAGTSVSFVAGDIIEVQIANGTGVTASIGLSLIAVQSSFA